MDEVGLFQYLSSQDVTMLLALLCKAYAEMNYDQRQSMFGDIVRALPPAQVEGEEIVFGDEIGTWMIPGGEKQLSLHT